MRGGSALGTKEGTHKEHCGPGSHELPKSCIETETLRDNLRDKDPHELDELIASRKEKLLGCLKETEYKFPVVVSESGVLLALGNKYGSEDPNDWSMVCWVDGEEEPQIVDIIYVSDYPQDNDKLGLLPNSVMEAKMIVHTEGGAYYLHIYKDKNKKNEEEEENEEEKNDLVVWYVAEGEKTATPYLTRWSSSETLPSEVDHTQPTQPESTSEALVAAA